MATAEVFSNTLFAPGYWASGGVDDLGAYSGGTAGTMPATLSGVLTKVGDMATATINGQTITLRAYSDLADGVLFTTTDFATFYAFLTAPFSAAQPYALSYTVAGQSELACFVTGTRIATPQGEVPVERLRRGARVRALRQGTAVVRWVGRQRIRGGGPRTWPVRIAAHAFAPFRPRRDLLLSPDHAVFAGGGLIPIRYLVNGATIALLPADFVEYWHVELTSHDLLLAEGLAAESYLDTGNRRCFDNPAAPRPPLSWTHHACARLLLTPASLVPERRRLLARAAALGHRTTDDPGLVLCAGGVDLPLARFGPVWRASLPPCVQQVRLRSRTSVPAEMLPGSDDRRRLGIAVTRLLLDGAEIPPGDPRRATGWLQPEPGLQWTGGDALLLCGEGLYRARTLEIATAPLLRYWIR
jgi:hypothetical protein